MGSVQQACLRNVPGNTIKRDIVTSPDKYGDNFSQMHFIAASPLVTAAPQHDAVRLTFSCFWSDHITSPFYNLEINQQLASGGQHFIETFLQVRYTANKSNSPEQTVEMQFHKSGYLEQSVLDTGYRQ